MPKKKTNAKPNRAQIEATKLEKEIAAKSAFKSSKKKTSSSEQAIRDRIRNLSAGSPVDEELDVKPRSVKKTHGIPQEEYAKKKEQKRESGKKKTDNAQKLKVIPLGGIGEIGKNLTLLEYGNDILLIDCGLGFPDEDMPGVDVVIPDMSYLEANRDKLRGLVLTHGHEDHVGGVPHLLKSFNIPVYGTRLTLKIVENKLKEFRLPWDADLRTVEAGDSVKLGCFSTEFIRVNHSIADACCLAITTPVGLVIHTGDFKLDLTPIDGDIMNITRLGELGRRGVLLLMCESTNAERPGYTPSERTVGNSLEYVFNTNEDKRLIISTFSSNVHRVQQIIDASERHGRKVAITGRSMINVISSAIELGYMTVKPGTLIDIGDMKRFRPGELTVVCTGSQGEPMSALYRMAYADRSPITLDHNDIVMISANAIPGNEKLVGRIINELCRRGIGVINDPTAGLHVSGHACAEEIKLMMALTRPKFFMPVHGEYRHLQANRKLGELMGIDDGNIFVSSLGQVLELTRRTASFGGKVPAGPVLVDGSGVGEVGEIVLRDRRLLSQDGIIVVFATVDLNERLILTRPDVISRGFVYMRESEELIEQLREIATSTLSSCLNKRGGIDRMQIKTRLRDDLSRFLYSKTKRRPMILPVIMDM